ncbi:MAG TPA: alanine racemase, partial [Patescibacteria group bacterium]|nr:alanine racemase [Patescibacteria group bacterium]
KANAYGHGIAGVSKILIKNGADWLCVASIEEAEVLRKSGVRKPVLIMGYVKRNYLSRAIQLRARMFIFDQKTVNLLSKKAKKLRTTALVHLKVDTGMSRQGINPRLLQNFIADARKLPNLKIEGVATHFANSDEPHHSFFQSQLSAFRALKYLIENQKTEYLFHAANSAATLLAPNSHFDLVRPGLALYGLYPSAETRKICLKKGLTLRPAMSFKTRVTQIKSIGAGSFVGYGLTHRVNKPAKIAILPVGYYDGLDRKLSNRGQVLIRNQRAPIVGRVCMDLIIVDITKIRGVKIEDEAVIIGRQGTEEITVEEIAKRAGTINYEIIARLRENLPRVYA